MNAMIGQPVSRVDGPAKVTGQAVYAAEFNLRHLAHAALVHSTIASGRITAMDTTAAEGAPGVLAVISHLNADRLPYRKIDKPPPVDPKAGEQLHVFQGPDVVFVGQPVAVVIAETRAQAETAAALVQVGYEEHSAATVLDTNRAKEPTEASAKAGRAGGERGDADAAWADAAVTIDMHCSHAREHHNALEPHATIAEWQDGRLTLYDKTQWVDNARTEIAHVFGMRESDIHVISPFVGGAFGSALRTWPHVTIAALAARRVHRPVRVELTRRELYSSIGYRPHTEQRMRLAAGTDGRLLAIVQDAVAPTSVYEEYAERTTNAVLRTYACPNVSARYRLVPLNANTPCPMRAPGLVSGVMALEMAMDELAEALAMDPLELRLRNHADRDPQNDAPWSSKELRACYRTAAERFGWRGIRQPRSMREGRTLIGHGMATAFYPAERSPASAQAIMYANDTVVVRTAASDMGPGTYTAMTQLAAGTLDLPIEQVHFELGDTDMPKAPVHGGSITLVSVGNAVVAACEALRGKLRALGDLAEGYGALMRRHGLQSLEAVADAKPGEETDKYASAAFGAVFAEVRVDADFGTVRVPRLVGAYDVGRVINPKIARSQCIGGMVGGIGMALMEQAEWDARFARVMNANLAEYLVPVNADAVDLDVTFVPSEDTIFNPLGAKGLAEIALCGVAPAIANAVYNATGKRIRDLPIMPDRLLMG